MDPVLETHISQYFKESDRLSKQRLIKLIRKDFPDWSYNTVNTYLSKLKKDGIISTPSRGSYKIDNKTSFLPKVSDKLKEIFNKIKLEFPYITFCVWDSLWLNDFMRHQTFKHYLVIEVEKDASESVFGFLGETIKHVFLNPNEEIFERYIHSLEEAIIIKNLISESPLIEVQKVIVPALEKILVDMVIDKELFSAQQNEMDFIMRRAMEQFTLNDLRMRRYAMRRNRVVEINGIVNIRLAK